MVESGEEGGDYLISGEGTPLRAHQVEKLKCKDVVGMFGIWLEWNELDKNWLER